MTIRDINGRDPFHSFVNQGWQCPVCKRVYAPFVPSCHHCNQGLEHTTAAPKTEVDARNISVLSIEGIYVGAEHIPALRDWISRNRP